jgi:RNA polymerase subunit RPABC4/transcription elongation factor Spt4
MTINQTPTRFKDELRIIPSWVFFLAVVVLVAVDVFFVCMLGRDRHSPPVAVRELLGVVAGAVVGCYILLIAYINRDSGRRRMSRWLWTLIAIIIPNALGIVLYFILRKPRTANCPQCQAEVEPGFSFCPRCRARLQPVCPHCQRSVELGNKFCPYCGGSLEPAASVPSAPDLGSNQP